MAVIGNVIGYQRNEMLDLELSELSRVYEIAVKIRG